MPYLILGLLILIGGLLLARAFVNADPAKLGRFLRWFLLTLGVAGAGFGLVYLVATERFAPALATAGGLVPLLFRGRTLWRRWQSAGAPAAGQTSEIETDWLRMRLDHDTGTTSGTVRRGPFQGRHLHELSRAELLRLWRECWAEDEPSARLLEAYLDRLMPDWREGEATGGAGSGRAATADAMTAEEAYRILELEAGADAAAIKAAHRRLIQKLHPDQGGSTWLAAKVNRAREVLLGG